MNLRYSRFAFVVVAPLAVRGQDDRECGTGNLQTDYRGDIAVTADNLVCQAWASQTPHSHSNTPENREGKGLGGVGNNYCRNPDNEPQGAWCYTTDPNVRWRYCNVPRCADVTMPTLAPTDFSSVAATPEEIAEAYSGPTTGVCANKANGEAVDRFHVDGAYASDADAPSSCFNLCAPYVDSPGFVGMQWRSISNGARCVCYFDDGFVPTTLPAGAKTDTDEVSVGPVVGGGQANHFCYAFTGYMDAERRSVYDGATLTDYVNFNVYGAPVQVANVEKEYDQNQNYEGKEAPTFSANHTTITADGNTWSSYLLPQAISIHKDSVLKFNFTLEEDTVDGFQAVCLDQDTEETGSNGKCFVLRSSQGWIKDMVNVPTLTGIGQTSSHSIPVGEFFTGPVNYLVLIQDSDGQDRTLGRSSISDLELISYESDQLEIEIDDAKEYITNNQISYTKDGESADFQDEKDFWLHLSEDHKAVQINGNQWKALPLNAPYDVTPSTVLEFDIVVDQSADFHAVCLDADTSASGDECVVVQSPIDSLSNFHHLTTKLQTGVPAHLVIPFGSFMGLGEGETMTVNNLVFIQDNDQADRFAGRSTWSGFKLYNSERHDVQVSIFGETVTIANIQEPLSNNGDDKDSRDHVMTVSAPSAEGSTVTATGNSWKYLALPSSIMVSPATVLKFTFSLVEESELHAICLLKSDRIQDSRPDCFFTAGIQSSASSQGVKITPFTEVGREETYEIIAGSYFTGEVKYIGFILDNDIGFTAGDVEQTIGQSSWGNIEIYNLPNLDITIDGQVMSVENDQISYESSSQDRTPIRDYMATISDDGSISFAGNMWRALELPNELSPTYLQDFVVSFKFTLDEAAEFHAICFEENLEYGDANNPQNPDPKRCVSTAYFQDKNQVLDVMLSDFQTRAGESHRYVLNLSKMLDKLYVNESGDPTPAPTPMPDLVRVGNNGSPSSAFPLQVCQGDCDNDGECAIGLKCFQRGGFETVPGCTGAGRSGTDYCYDPYRKQTNIKYIAFIADNDDDENVGDATFGDIAITTSLSSCLNDADFDFQLSDCTIKNFLGKVEEAMANKGTCQSTDALLELFAIFDATQETDVYKEIENICTSAYKLDQYDFADSTLSTDESLERQLVKEYIDGGTIMNYEEEADSVVKIGRVNDKFASSRVLAMPKHHALDRCDVGAAMCCFVDSRTSLADNANVCYVDMKASKYTAHVRDGYSIYGASTENVYCEGFAWGNDGGIASALKGNALFNVGFLENFASGSVEQVPGAPLCGCMDRMPVVTAAACTNVTAPTSVVDVHFDSAAGLFDADYTAGTIQYGDCGGLNLVEHYETLVADGKASAVDAAYMHERVVGEDGCNAAINDFLAEKGLQMA